MKDNKKLDLSNAQHLDESQAKNITAEGEEDFNSLPEEKKAPKVEACEGKGYHDYCTWEHEGVLYSGRCVYNPYALSPELYCSDVFKKDKDN